MTELVLGRYEPVIGLEVHCQLATTTKLFCGCSAAFGALPNKHVCPVCLGLPGSLPVLNKKATELAIQVALAVEAQIEKVSIFARKQYFYPDLPKGYQITQFELPYCRHGKLKIQNDKTVDITRIHIEEDAGKNVHEQDHSYVDLNRAGTPLIEIVTEPCLHSASDAADYFRRLRSLVRHIGASDGNMQEGSLRCDANVSLRPAGQTQLGTRAEIKNLNSFKNIERAINYEMLRQADNLDMGVAIEQQTLLFDPSSGKTKPMRSKEESHDYRYFPDPDLPPLIIDEERIDKARKALPELPQVMAQRFVEQHGITAYDASVLTSDRDLASYFEATVQHLTAKAEPKTDANWITGELLKAASDGDWDLADPPIPPQHLAKMINLMGDGTISGKIAKTVFAEMVQSPQDPEQIVAAKGLKQVSDVGAIGQLVKEVVAANPDQVAEFRSGKTKVMGFFVGQVMKKSGGKMNPKTVNELLQKHLKGDV